MTRQSGSWLIAVALVSAYSTGCSSSSNSSNGIMTEKEVVSFCNSLIKKVENESDPAQLDGFEQAKQYVDEYDFANPAPKSQMPAPSDPETIEPTDEADLYRMFGAMALLQGSNAASSWLTAQSLLLDPDDPDSLSQLGITLIDQNRCKDAERLLKTAISLDVDKNELLLLSLAAAQACQNKTAKAEQTVAEALKTAPKSVMARTAMMDYREQQVDYIVGLEDSLYALCEDEINQALNLSSVEQINGFIMQKQQEAQQLLQQMLDMTNDMPADVPFELISTLADLYTEFNLRLNDIENKLDQKMETVSNQWEAAVNDLGQQLGDCCAAAGGGACCGCFREHCSGGWGYLMNSDLPHSNEALVEYLEDALNALIEAELKFTGILMSEFPGMSDESVVWTAEYVYSPLNSYCKSIAGNVAAVQMHMYGARDFAEASCDATELLCKTEEYLAEWEAKRREAERLEAQKAAEARKRARKLLEGRDDSIRGELCLDALGCLGIDAGKFSVKIGGPIFAQFSIDTDKLSLGVRVGAGISDPTGGNIAGADISVGGEIGVSGTSFDVTHSQSAALGTIKHDYHLFKRSFKY